MCHSYSALPTRLDFLRESAGTKGFDKKKKTGNQLTSRFLLLPGSASYRVFIKRLCFHGIEFSNFLAQRCSSDPLGKYSLWPSATGP